MKTADAPRLVAYGTKPGAYPFSAPESMPDGLHRDHANTLRGLLPDTTTTSA